MSFSRHLHLELCRIARELNSIFGIQMTFELASCFLYLTGLCHHLCKMIMRESDHISAYGWFSMSIWVPSFLLKIYSINYVCESVSLKVKLHSISIIHINKFINIIWQIPNFRLIKLAEWSMNYQILFDMQMFGKM